MCSISFINYNYHYNPYFFQISENIKNIQLPTFPIRHFLSIRYRRGSAGESRRRKCRRRRQMCVLMWWTSQPPPFEGHVLRCRPSRHPFTNPRPTSPLHRTPPPHRPRRQARFRLGRVPGT